MKRASSPVVKTVETESYGETETKVAKIETADGQIITLTNADATELTEEMVNPMTETIVVEQDPGAADEFVNTVELVQSEDGQAITVQSEDGQHITVIEADGSTLDGEIEQADDTLDLLQPAPTYQNIIIQCMDIAQPLDILRKLLENRLQCSLAQHDFYLQDNLQLDPSKNLVEQCVQGEGLVQINVEIKSQPGLTPKINIVDILKPAEEVTTPVVQQTTTQATPTKVVIPFPEESDHVTRWIVDQNFRREQDRLKIPTDPLLWNETHVKHWVQWGIKEFQLTGVNVEDFNITGKTLCELTHEEFVKFVPNDKGDIFWTHLELLRKCKFVAIVQQPTPHAITTVTVSTSGVPGMKKIQGKGRSPRIAGDGWSPGNRTGNNGQIQLWQFLLELLTDKDCREVIHWAGDDGEFKLNNPEMVAQMWGQRKNKPTMNYEKLSRALRYYYDGDMIAKVHGKRFVYKFVCDLKMLLGYTAGELNQLVTESAEKKLQKVRESLIPGTSWKKATGR